MRTNTAVGAPDASPVPSVSARRKRVNLGAIATEKPKTGVSKYPVLLDELGTAATLAAVIRDTRTKLDALQAQEKTKVAELKNLVIQWYWPHYSGQRAVESSVSVRVDDDTNVLVSLQDRYSAGLAKTLGVDGFREKISMIIGEDAYDELFGESFEVTVDGEKIPEAKQQEFVDGLAKLCADLGCANAAVAKPTVKHRERFHNDRHSMLTVEENKALNELYPITIAVKTEGVK